MASRQQPLSLEKVLCCSQTMSTTAASTSPTDVGQALINALNNPTGNLTRSLLLADEDGNITGKKGPRFILQSYGYLGTRYSPFLVALLQLTSCCQI